MDMNEGAESTEVVDEQAGVGAVDTAGNVIKIGEEEVPYERVEKVWKDYANDQKWRARNTQESQRVAEQAKYVEKARKLEDWLNANPDKYAQIESIIKAGGTPAQAMAQAGQGSGIDMSQLERIRDEVGGVAEEIKVAREMDTLKSKYPDYFKDTGFEAKLVRHCLDKGISDLALGLRDMTYDMVMSKNQGQVRTDQAKEKSKALGMPNGSKGAKPTGKKIPMGSKEWKASVLADDSIWEE